MKAKKKPVHQLTVPQFEAAFPDDDACKAYLMDHRWPSSVCCPRCGYEKVYILESRAFHWQCQNCAKDGYRFSVLVGTIFENTNIKLRDWFRVIHLMLTSKKGMSALQIHRMMGFGSYRTAWSMCHRIRTALQEDDFRKLMGIVEVDETLIGGKTKNRHSNKRGGPGGTAGGGTKPGRGSGKAIVVGAVRRKGNIVARVIKNVRHETLNNFVRESVSNRVSLLITDDFGGYDRLKYDYPHKVINHAAGNYVVGAVHTNTIEGFWSMIKRGIVGTYHKVSRKYLPLYVAEFEFRYNNRKNDDIFGAAISQCG